MKPFTITEAYAGTDADNIYIASIYLNKYFDKRLARTAHRFDVNIPDVFAETKAQRALYDMYYLNATASMQAPTSAQRRLDYWKSILY
jgi:hypothetical protein